MTSPVSLLLSLSSSKLKAETVKVSLSFSESFNIIVRVGEGGRRTRGRTDIIEIARSKGVAAGAGVELEEAGTEIKRRRSIRKIRSSSTTASPAQSPLGANTAPSPNQNMFLDCEEFCRSPHPDILFSPPPSTFSPKNKNSTPGCSKKRC